MILGWVNSLAADLYLPNYGMFIEMYDGKNMDQQLSYSPNDLGGCQGIHSIMCTLDMIGYPAVIEESSSVNTCDKSMNKESHCMTFCQIQVFIHEVTSKSIQLNIYSIKGWVTTHTHGYMHLMSLSTPSTTKYSP